MSIVVESTAVKKDPRLSLAFTIINNIVPTIMNPANFIGQRLAVAYSYYKLICKLEPQLCRQKNIPPQIKDWKPKTIEEVADILIEYASRIINRNIKQETQEEIGRKIMEKYEKPGELLPF